MNQVAGSGPKLRSLIYGPGSFHQTSLTLLLATTESSEKYRQSVFESFIQLFVLFYICLLFISVVCYGFYSSLFSHYKRLPSKAYSLFDISSSTYAQNYLFSNHRNTFLNNPYNTSRLRQYSNSTLNSVWNAVHNNSYLRLMQYIYYILCEHKSW